MARVRPTGPSDGQGQGRSHSSYRHSIHMSVRHGLELMGDFDQRAADAAGEPRGLPTGPAALSRPTSPVNSAGLGAAQAPPWLEGPEGLRSPLFTPQAPSDSSLCPRGPARLAYPTGRSGNAEGGPSGGQRQPVLGATRQKSEARGHPPLPPTCWV